MTRLINRTFFCLAGLFLWVTAAIAGVNEDFVEAAERGDLSAVTNFIAKGANVNAKVDNGITALMAASLNGHKEVVELLLAKGANVNVKNGGGATALIIASLNDHKEVVELLLAKGANVNVKNDGGMTALKYASQKGHEEIVQILKKAGAVDVATVNEDFFEAAKSGRLSAVKNFIDKGVDVNSKADNGWTALMWTADQGHLEVVKLLLEKGAAVDAKANNGATPLFRAAQEGHLEVVNVLLANGANVNARDNNRWNALMNSSLNGHLEMAQALLAKGADINATAKDGTTALIVASLAGNKEIVELLLAKGANVNAKAKDGMTAVGAASKNSHQEVEAVLMLGQTTTKAQNSAAASPKAAKAEQYRVLTPKDNLYCGARVANMGYTFFGTPSGELVGFECLDKEGKTRSIELKSKEFTDGKIETQDFGIILMKRTTMAEAAAGRPTTDPLSVNYEMTESQIKKLKTFLGFILAAGAKK